MTKMNSANEDDENFPSTPRSTEENAKPVSSPFHLVMYVDFPLIITIDPSGEDCRDERFKAAVSEWSDAVDGIAVRYPCESISAGETETAHRWTTSGKKACQAESRWTAASVARLRRQARMLSAAKRTKCPILVLRNHQSSSRGFVEVGTFNEVDEKIPQFGDSHNNLFLYRTKGLERPHRKRGCWEPWFPMPTHDAESDLAKSCGRFVSLVEASEVHWTLTVMAARGMASAELQTCDGTGDAWIVDFSRCGTSEAAFEHLLDLVGLPFLHLACVHPPERFQVQEIVVLRDIRRFHVFRGKLRSVDASPVSEAVLACANAAMARELSDSFYSEPNYLIDIGINDAGYPVISTIDGFWDVDLSADEAFQIMTSLLEEITFEARAIGLDAPGFSNDEEDLDNDEEVLDKWLDVVWPMPNLECSGARASDPLDVCIVVSLRYDGKDELTIEPSRGNEEAQKLLADAWKAAWASSVCPPVECVELIRYPRKFLDTHEIYQEAKVAKSNRYHDAQDAERPVRGRHEHIHEDAAKLTAALSFGVPVYGRNWQGNETFRYGSDLTLDVRLRVPELCERMQCVWFGYTNGMHRFLSANKAIWRPRESSMDLSDRYWRNDGFMAHAGREIACCTGSELPWTLAAMASEGHVRAFVKAMASKVGVWTIELPSGCTAASLARSIWTVMGETYLQASTHYATPGFLVQEYVPFHREMRMFIVCDRIVDAVPVRRRDTVHDRIGRGRIDPRTCIAHDGADAEEDRAEVARYVRAARKVIAAIATAQNKSDRGSDYVLDMGSDGYGRILPIELNSLSQAGTYAADPHRVIEALMAACKMEFRHRR